MAAGRWKGKKKNGLTMFTDLWRSGSPHEVDQTTCQGAAIRMCLLIDIEYRETMDGAEPKKGSSTIHFFHWVFFFTLLTTRQELQTSDSPTANNRGGMGRESGIAQPDDMQGRTPSLDW